MGCDMVERDGRMGAEGELNVECGGLGMCRFGEQCRDDDERKWGGVIHGSEVGRSEGKR